MLPPGLGWSASDIVLAIKVLHKLCHAFRDASGASAQYESTVAFLDAFARTMQRIQSYVDASASVSATMDVGISADLGAQIKLIYTEYVKFDNYLRRVEPGLSSASFTTRIAARAKWAVREIDAKVEGLKKAVVTPMMFVAPLLAVETLVELRAIREKLADAAGQEDAVRENRMLIVKINEDLGKLKGCLESYWWNRRWAMTAVEEDVKSLTLAVKNNSDLIENSKLEMREAVVQETARVSREQAAANIATISAIEEVMEAKLAWIENSVDVLISQHRSKTGKEDPELHAIKQRVSNARKHLNQAARAARQCLKSFGHFVKAVNTMHRNPVTRWMLPLADSIIGYDKIFEHGEKMVKSAGETVVASGKFVDESDVMQNLKNWNPFAVGPRKPAAPRPNGCTGGGGGVEASTTTTIGSRKIRNEDSLLDVDETGSTASTLVPTSQSSAPRSRTISTSSTTASNASAWSSSTTTHRPIFPSKPDSGYNSPGETIVDYSSVSLLDMDERTSSSTHSRYTTDVFKPNEPKISLVAFDHVEDNPWA